MELLEGAFVIGGRQNYNKGVLISATKAHRPMEMVAHSNSCMFKNHNNRCRENLLRRLMWCRSFLDVLLENLPRLPPIYKV